MPSFIGSSFIPGNYASRGLTGITGITGNTGPVGNPGITAGPTGGTGDYFASVFSDLNNNTIRFTTNQAPTTQYTFTGFTGATGYWSDSRGASAAIGAGYYSAFKDVSGITLRFLGISGGTNASVSLDTVNDTIVVSFSSANSSLGVSGATGYVPFIRGNTLSASKLFVNPDNSLNLGFTNGMALGVAPQVPVYADFKNINMVNIPATSAAQRASGLGGITLDLSQGGLFWINTPIGITAFSGGVTLGGVRQHYTLFINGSDVWNLPKNLYFNNDVGTESSLGFLGFLDGLNVLEIWSDDCINFNARIAARGINTVGNTSIRVFNWGSCCDSGTCTDNVLFSNCNTTGRVFKSFVPCSQRTDCTAFAGSSTGACCCGVTGCIDSSNSNGKTVDAAFCASIGGTFKPNKSCAPGDKSPGFFSNTTRPNNTADGLICPNGCLPPVCCCDPTTNTASQETKWYCEQLGKIAIPGVPAAGANCSTLLQQGWCRQTGICNPTKMARWQCTGCGVFYPDSQYTFAQCQAGTGIVGVPNGSSVLDFTTPNPNIKIIHSVNTATNTDVYTTYTDNTLDTYRATALRLKVSSVYTTSYRLTGSLVVDDINITPTKSSFDIWNTTDGIKFVVYDGNGTVLTSSSVLQPGSDLNIRIDSDVTALSGASQLGADQNFAGRLVLNLVPCSAGVPAPTTVPVAYTRSPCRCLQIGGAGKGITGDINNKEAYTIPFTATRYCTHCTTKRYSGTSTSKVVHQPYPLKTQTGFLTFCPPLTDNPVAPGCTLSQYWCAYYGAINEISGCTYSSLIDSNDDNFLISGSNENNVYGGSKLGPENNTLPNKCPHIEYNAPGSGTTYWFHGDWSYVDLAADIAAGTINVRNCNDNDCRRVNPAWSGCSGKTEIDTGICGVADSRSTTCKTCAGWPLFEVHPNQLSRGAIDDFCFDYQPYYNVLSFDADALSKIASDYSISPALLQAYLNDLIQGYKDAPDGAQSGGLGIPSARDGVLFNPLKQNSSVVLAGSSDSIGTSGSNPNPDELATNSCANCSNKFDKTVNIQIPWVIADLPTTTFDVFGLVMLKETPCSNQGGQYSGRTDCRYGYDGVCIATAGNNECPTLAVTWYDYKYYIIVMKTYGTQKTFNVYDIGTASELYSDIGDSQYEATCGGGRMICNTDCAANNSRIKEFKWFGSVDKNTAAGFATGFCNDSKRLNYTIKKQLNGIVPAGTGLYPISDVIGFNSGIIYTAANETSKKNTVATELFSRIFGKEKIDDYNSVRFDVCPPNSDVNCNINMIPELVEFVGKGCYVDGFEAGALFEETYEFDNTNNANKITLKRSGIPAAVWWLNESLVRTGYSDIQDFRKPYYANGQEVFLVHQLETTADKYLHNFSSTLDPSSSDPNKYFEYSSACPRFYPSGPVAADQTCALGQKYFDNRFLKTYNLSYLDTRNGELIKRKTIYESPLKGITIQKLVYDTGSGKTGAVQQPTYYCDQYDTNEVLHIGETCYPGNPNSYFPGSNVKVLTKFIPKIDLSSFRPVTTILATQLVVPNRANGETDYTLRIRFGGSDQIDTRTARQNNETYVKFLYLKTNGAVQTIIDITPLVKIGFNSGQYISTTHSALVFDKTEISVNTPTGSSALYMNPVTDPSGYGYGYMYHEISGVKFDGINTSNSSITSGSYAKFSDILTGATELCDVPGNCSATATPGAQTGLARAFENGKVYVLVKEVAYPDRVNGGGMLQAINAEWIANGIVPPKGDDGISYLHPIDNSGYINIALADFALKKIGTSSITASLTSSGELKNKNVDGQCMSIDCTNIPDLCNDLENC